MAEIAGISRTYGQKDVSFVAISAHDVKLCPEDGPDEMKIPLRPGA
jgi:hypothetical protein